MPAIGLTQDRSYTVTQPVRSVGTLQRILLACGMISSLLYLATDILGGMRYEGYSFSSQMVSELMAVGAPSERFVDPLFITYGVFMLLFAVGVVREAAGVNRALRIAGLFLIAYAIVGFTGPTLFEMHPRGSTLSGSDTPHIVLTGVIALCTLLAMGFAAFALDVRFRIYSFATMLTMLVFGALAGSSAALLAAGEPTPGFGAIERVNIYSSMLWVAVLAIVLLRRSDTAVRSAEGARP